MDLLYSFFMLFLLAMVPFIEAMFSVPVAVLLGMPLAPVIIVAFIGNLISILITIWIIYSVKNARQRRKNSKNTKVRDKEGFVSKRRNRGRRLWERYGMPGLTIIGMFLLGGHITALVACSFTKNRMRVTLWMAISILIWGGGFGIAAYFGYDFVSNHPWVGILEQNT